MICSENWSFEHYQPLDRTEVVLIDRVAPGKTEIALSWCGGTGRSVVRYRRKGSAAAFAELAAVGTFATITGLTEHEDYEFYVACENGQSRLRFARTGEVPGVVVNYLHPEDAAYDFSGQHLCTPSLLKHPAGYLLASMDVFEGGAPQNLTMIFRSDDDGANWYHYTELFPCYWGTLFLHNGEVYMLATSTEYGDLLIGRSSDGGKNWGKPTVLARGSCHSDTPGWHKSSMPVICHKGRLWCGVDYGSHHTGGHMSCLASARADGDLLNAENWCITEPLPYDPCWEGAVKGDTRGLIEGNAVVLPDGEIGNMLRYFTNRGTPSYGLAGLLRGNCENPENALRFERFVPFPGNLSKFDVKKDAQTGLYFSILTRIVHPDRVKARDMLSLACSADLVHWQVLCDLIDGTGEDPETVGFQYVSFLFDGDDLIFLCRTAFNGAQSYHDNNYITFHRVPRFRNLTEKQP